MLEGVAIELGVIIEVIGVSEEVVTCAEYITTAHVWTWQTNLLWTCDFKAVFRLEVQRFAHFVA